MVFSARRGFFDVITTIMNRPASPEYYDAVGKITYDLDPDNRISVVGFYYLDRISRTGDTPESKTMSKYPYMKRDDYGSALGVNWRSLISSNAYTLTTFSFSGNGWTTQQGTETNPTMAGEEIRENVYAIKNETVVQLSGSHEVKGGVQLFGVDPRHETWSPADTTRRGEIIPASSVVFRPSMSTKLDYLFKIPGNRYPAFQSPVESDLIAIRLRMNRH